MAINPARLIEWNFPVSEHTITPFDAMLYALGVGLGSNPMDTVDLKYIYEQDMSVLPTMATVIGHPGPWYKDPATGIDWINVVQGEQALEVHSPLVVGTTLLCETSVIDVEDKGPGRGALVRWKRELRNASTGTPVSTVNSTLFCRNDGGFGGERRASEKSPEWMSSIAPSVVESHISTRAALLFRLSGDFNPIHIDPDSALQAGFKQPILHGLCTFAVAIIAIDRKVGDANGQSLESVRARFKAPVTPGQTLRTEYFAEDRNVVRFRSRTIENNELVLDDGYAAFQPNGAV